MALCHLCLAGPAEQRVSGYTVTVCRLCWRRAETGWPKEFEPALMAALGRAGLLIPDRTESGLLPREYAPPDDFAL